MLLGLALILFHLSAVCLCCRPPVVTSAHVYLSEEESAREVRAPVGAAAGTRVASRLPERRQRGEIKKLLMQRACFPGAAESSVRAAFLAACFHLFHTFLRSLWEV